MPRQVKLDLRGAPPVSGGTRDHIPAGRYPVKITKMEDTTSKTGKRMWACSFKVSAGESAGSNLSDNFVFVENSGQPSKMGLGKLHHMLLCLGLPVKEAVITLDLDRFTDMELEVDVSDEKFTDSSGNERVSSNIRNYFPARHANGSGGVTSGTPATATISPAPESATIASAVEELSPEEAEDVGGEIEDLFK